MTTRKVIRKRDIRMQGNYIGYRSDGSGRFTRIAEFFCEDSNRPLETFRVNYKQLARNVELDFAAVLEVARMADAYIQGVARYQTYVNKAKGKEAVEYESIIAE